jgi:deoxyadenosine/deoxycytidine kinase
VQEGVVSLLMMENNYPYLRTRSKDKNLRIEVMADSLRVGKTTAVSVIAEGLRKAGKTVTESYEDWQHNPYLKKSYTNPAKNFLESQKWFIKRKWEQVKEGAKKDVFLQDVSPEMDYCYAETNRRLRRMSEDDFAEYDKFYRSLDWTLAPAPDLLVYLSVSDDVLIRRAMDSKREFETVEPEYFLMMKKVNREWLVGAKQKSNYKILEIDTDKLDFAHEEGAKQQLVKMVMEKLDLV